MNPHSPFPKRTREHGATLLLAVWALLILSMAIMFWTRVVQQGILISGQMYGEVEARAQAHSGIALGLHPMVTKETPLLTDYEEADPGFVVRIVSEGGKLNVNFLLIGENPNKIELFKRWLEYRGLSFKEREHFVDCLLDWIDADNLKHINGAEDSDGYHPLNRGQFFTVEEIADVEGAAPLVATPGWQDELTIYSQGPIDVTSAEFSILRLLPGVSDRGIQNYLMWRAGADQLDGTLDDPKIDKLETVQLQLGLNKEQWNALGGLIMPKDNTSRIISIGHAGKVVRQVEVVAHKGLQNPQILFWKE
jgi:general secretion pathway protein K